MTRHMAHISLSSIQLLNYTRHTVAQLTLRLSRTDVLNDCRVSSYLDGSDMDHLLSVFLI